MFLNSRVNTLYEISNAEMKSAIKKIPFNDEFETILMYVRSIVGKLIDFDCTFDIALCTFHSSVVLFRLN